MKNNASGSSSFGLYFPFEAPMEWDDDRGLAEWRSGRFADEVDEARGRRCGTERGFERLETDGSEARGARDEEEADELLPERGGR